MSKCGSFSLSSRDPCKLRSCPAEQLRMLTVFHDLRQAVATTEDTALTYRPHGSQPPRTHAPSALQRRRVTFWKNSTSVQRTVIRESIVLPLSDPFRLPLSEITSHVVFVSSSI